VGPADLERIRLLKIPPAWTHVALNRFPHGRLQAIGKDKAGRWQYQYHPAFVRQQEERKYQRLISFARALPKLRRAVGRGLKSPASSREAVMSCILRVLSCCFMRPGSQVYADENGSYGIATLQRRHVSVSGDTVTFRFRGKAGQQQERSLEDPRVARVIRYLKKLPGSRLFRRRDDDGNLVPIRRRHINAFIKEIMGAAFTAKDFRTWAGTLNCACALARAGANPSSTRRETRRRVIGAIRETAQLLGNTPAICRSSYIQPSVLHSYERGKVINRYFNAVDELNRTASLHPSERALLALLKASGSRSAAAAITRIRRKLPREAPAKAA
jgi:DNA topoisomerase-1